ncbi:pyridoxal phosphate-dependent transferase [Pisolithus croceorrhizus]|nr:pyridoxal phosphate-dependent transferase [Pisolithus croceorrhizus]
MTAVVATGNDTLGDAVPPFTPHAISVSLPTWRDNVGYEEGEKRVVESMVSGYPRFFIHLSIQKLASICEQKFCINGEKSLLCSSKGAADHCREFILARVALSGISTHVRLVRYLVRPEHAPSQPSSSTDECVELHIILFPADIFPIAKQFWQHTGMGISSRFAERCLAILGSQQPLSPVAPSRSPVSWRSPYKASNKHYSKHIPASPSLGGESRPSASLPSCPPEALCKDQDTYIEERYGRNLPLSAGAHAKRALRRRIAGVLVHDTMDDGPHGPSAGALDAELGPSSRGVKDVTENDVFLFPTGMAAIWNAHQLALAVRPVARSVCFGFPYTDTLKILQKWGPGCHFFGHGQDSDADALENLLEQTSSENPSTPPILAIFTEFPSNPLLRSPDLTRLRSLADKYDFLIVVDDTIGNFVNIEVLPYADVVVSSLSKIFSGCANTMGGSLVLNPQGRHYAALKQYLSTNYEDVYFSEDALFMERNSHANTEAICDFLRARSLSGNTSHRECIAIKEVYYPKYFCPTNYAICQVPEGGYGGLFSLTFTSLAASRAFFDALPCLKGPSLGTNFTLACPYTILAHYNELEWAAEYGVEEGLVRISVGMEEKEDLMRCFEVALKAAETATAVVN